MSDQRDLSPEEALAPVARFAGIALTPEYAPSILARLNELREGVLIFGETIADDTAPALRFIAG